MTPILLDVRSRLHLLVDKWGRQFVQRLLTFTHSQWICRNSRVHHRGEGGLTVAEHASLLNRVEDLMDTDPDNLLPCHRHLLEVDFGALGSGSSASRRVWALRMESARDAARLVRTGQVSDGDAALFLARDDTSGHAGG